MKVLHSQFDEPAFPGKIGYYNIYYEDVIISVLESIYMQSAPSPNVIQFDMNSPSNQNFSSQFLRTLLFISLLFLDNNNPSNREQEKKNLGANAQSSLRTITNLNTSDRSVLDAITMAINNHMKPTIIATNKRKKQIDRPFGESLTSVDAYIKIKNKENIRKKNRQRKIIW
ncbi:unnamed protein product [Rotaria sordida]|nr:unnamed protein product [Rotaria sordida]CAF1023659.1 unnamed protein product [Rotaria sordida]CAF3874675.1 unnamed protein product [Rotaria sordida]CAF3950110.1 unnamed protein product [Rotaria sordida]CAF3985927.1 unnamed protein product [Rotaria sordida]